MIEFLNSVYGVYLTCCVSCDAHLVIAVKLYTIVGNSCVVFRQQEDSSFRSEYLVFDGSQKPKLKQTIKLEKLIDSVFYNNKYIGVAYSNNDKKCTSHIKLYDFNGKMLMENDTAIAYNSIEFDSNNEV